ncbi:hypothetical protein SLE2022_251590 [Rubroshorea leprosula]
MWRKARLGWQRSLRRLSTAVRRRTEDEGDWFYSSEWWGSDSESEYHGNTVLRSTSSKGNGVVSVLAYPSSRPNKVYWTETEKWLQQRYAQIHPGYEQDQPFRILGYQWRVLRFNDNTRQSTVKIMAAYRETEPGSIFLMQQSHCLAVPYLKSMVAVGLSTLASCGYDLNAAVRGKTRMHILCIGHGGGSLPLFLASKIKGAIIHVVEIDPLVISSSIQAMGFPAFSIMTPSGERAMSKPSILDEVLWKGIQERLYLYESDAEQFVLENNNLYDMVFIDAYDGDDIFPRKLWDPDSLFLRSLRDQLHPEHGTVVVNLHSDADTLYHNDYTSYSHQQLTPMGKYVSSVCQAYKEALASDSHCSKGKQERALGFTVSVPWVCNTSLVVCRGFELSGGVANRNMVMNTLISKSLQVEYVMNFPFSCFEYIKRDFFLFE